MVIIKENGDDGAWWFKTAEDAFKDLQNSFNLEDLPNRQDFIDNMDNHITMYVEGYDVFSASEGDQ